MELSIPHTPQKKKKSGKLEIPSKTNFPLDAKLSKVVSNDSVALGLMQYELF